MLVISRYRLDHVDGFFEPRLSFRKRVLRLKSKLHGLRQGHGLAGLHVRAFEKHHANERHRHAA